MTSQKWCQDEKKMDFDYKKSDSLAETPKTYAHTKKYNNLKCVMVCPPWAWIIILIIIIVLLIVFITQQHTLNIHFFLPFCSEFTLKNSQQAFINDNNNDNNI